MKAKAVDRNKEEKKVIFHYENQKTPKSLRKFYVHLRTGPWCGCCTLKYWENFCSSSSTTLSWSRSSASTATASLPGRNFSSGLMTSYRDTISPRRRFCLSWGASVSSSSRDVPSLCSLAWSFIAFWSSATIWNSASLLSSLKDYFILKQCFPETWEL